MAERDERANLLENYLPHEDELPPLQLLLLPHAMRQHEAEASQAVAALEKQVTARAATLRATAAAERAPIENVRDAQIEKIMAEARRKCERIERKQEPTLSAIAARLEAELADLHEQSDAEQQRAAEPMRSLKEAAEIRAEREGWKRCEYYFTHENGTKGCECWFRPEDACADCDTFGTLEAASEEFTGCDRHLRICRSCRCEHYDTKACQTCDLCECDDCNGGDTENFCEEHMELHEDYCIELHSRLCGYGEGEMHSGHCTKPVEARDQPHYLQRHYEFHDESCHVATCHSCLWTCDGSRVDDGDSPQDCGTAYCPTCMPRDLRASIEAAKERDRQSGSGHGHGHKAQYCGHCVGDGSAWEEEEQQRRSRKRALQSLQRGEYVHPSHYMDEDAYDARCAGGADGSEHSE